MRAGRPSEDRLRRAEPGSGRSSDRLPRSGQGIRRIEVKGRTARPAHPPDHERVVQGDAARRQLLALRRLGPARQSRPVPLIIRNPVKHLDHAKREVIAARHYDIPAEAIEKPLHRAQKEGQ